MDERRLKPAAEAPLRWLSTKQAALYLNLSVSTLERMRREKTGPRCYLAGKRKWSYHQSECDSWLRREKV